MYSNLFLFAITNGRKLLTSTAPFWLAFRRCVPTSTQLPARYIAYNGTNKRPELRNKAAAAAQGRAF